MEIIDLEIQGIGVINCDDLGLRQMRISSELKNCEIQKVRKTVLLNQMSKKFLFMI